MVKDYFEKYEEWTEFKHKIIEHYLWRWAAHVGQHSPDHKLFYVDGFAGRGIYEQKYPGSPLIVAKISMEYSKPSKKKKRSIECIFVEKDKKLSEDLKISLAELGFEPFHIHTVSFDQDVKRIIDRVRGHPAFIFIDPYGVKPIPLSALKPLFELKGKTELMINFNITGLNRLAGWFKHNAEPNEQGFLPLIKLSDKQLKRSKKTKESNIKIITAVLGSEKWIDIIGEYEYNSDAFYEKLLEIYKGNLASGNFTIIDHYPVREKRGIEGRLKYYLIHCAYHEKAREVMRDVFSRESKKAELPADQTRLPFE